MRYVALHPRLRLAWATAASAAGRAVGDVFPNLGPFIRQQFVSADAGEARLAEAGVVFLALPHNGSQEVLPRLVRAFPDKVWVDMAGDFRSPDPAGYRHYYGREHVAPELLDSFVYGFTEAQRENLRGARRIANPGCFATGMLLALWPLVEAGLIDGPVFVTGITGSSGSGRQPSATTHHPERAQNVRAYKPLAHQHLLEVESFLNRRSKTPVQLQFVPQSAPVARGIFTTVFLPGQPVDRVRGVYAEVYGDSPLIDIVRGSPDLRVVQTTPRSLIGVDGAPGRGAVVFSVIDNLGKGAAGQAIQNVNCALDFPEAAGLEWPGGFV